MRYALSTGSLRLNGKITALRSRVDRQPTCLCGACAGLSVDADPGKAARARRLISSAIRRIAGQAPGAQNVKMYGVAQCRTKRSSTRFVWCLIAPGAQNDSGHMYLGKAQTTQTFSPAKVRPSVRYWAGRVFVNQCKCSGPAPCSSVTHCAARAAGPDQGPSLQS